MPVAAVQPDESVTLTTTVQVRHAGIEEGIYGGVIRVDMMQHHQQFYGYSIDVPEEYVVPDDEFHQANITVEAHGPNVNSTASFQPKRQVAMRKGSTTMTVSVKPVPEKFQPPAEGITVRTDIPDGWKLQDANENASLSVWFVETNKAGKEGARTKLRADDYEVTTSDNAIIVRIADVRNTAYGSYLTTGEHLALDVKLNKKPKADAYDYEARVDTETRSPWAIYRYERPAAAIDIFDPRPATNTGPVNNEIDRVPGHAIRVDGDGEGVNGTLTNPGRYSLDINGKETWWIVMNLETSNRGDRQAVWLPLKSKNGSFDATVTEDGYLVMDGYTTPHIHSAIASEMQSGTPITIQLPADENLTVGANVTVDDLHTTANGTDTGVVFETSADTPAATVNADVIYDDEELKVVIPAVVGEQLADQENNE